MSVSKAVKVDMPGDVKVEGKVNINGKEYKSFEAFKAHMQSIEGAKHNRIVKRRKAERQRRTKAARVNRRKK